MFRSPFGRLPGPKPAAHYAQGAAKSIKKMQEAESLQLHLSGGGLIVVVLNTACLHLGFDSHVPFSLSRCPVTAG